MEATSKKDISSIQLETSRVRALYLLSLAQPAVARRRRLYALTKRIFDLLLAALLLLLFAPLMLVIALVIKVTSPGPAILVQERGGKGGKIFAFYKFRSMYNNSDNTEDEQYAREYIHGNHQAARPRSGVFKPANDKRITPVGKWLRKTSLDELPQLLNVLKGDMSLVGPRPSMPYEVDVYKPWHFRRLEVLPGITGLAQIKGRSSLTFQEIVSIDLEYIERRSLLLDLEILLKTLPVVLSARGAR